MKAFRSLLIDESSFMGCPHIWSSNIQFGWIVTSYSVSKCYKDERSGGDRGVYIFKDLRENTDWAEIEAWEEMLMLDGTLKAKQKQQTRRL